jgi:hypothetical protein
MTTELSELVFRAGNEAFIMCTCNLRPAIMRMSSQKYKYYPILGITSRWMSRFTMMWSCVFKSSSFIHVI